MFTQSSCSRPTPARILITTHYHVTVAVLIVQWRRPADIKGARCCVAGVRRCRGQVGFPDSSLPRGTRYRENPTRHTGWTPPFSSVLLPRGHRGLPFAMTGSYWTSRCRKPLGAASSRSCGTGVGLTSSRRTGANRRGPCHAAWLCLTMAKRGSAVTVFWTAFPSAARKLLTEAPGSSASAVAEVMPSVKKKKKNGKRQSVVDFSRLVES